jgi:hypothetical protein
MFLSCPDCVAVERVQGQRLSAGNSLYQGKIQGIYGLSRLLAAVQVSGLAIPRQFTLAPCVAPFVKNRELTGNLPYINGTRPTRELLNFRLVYFSGFGSLSCWTDVARVANFSDSELDILASHESLHTRLMSHLTRRHVRQIRRLRRGEVSNEPEPPRDGKFRLPQSIYLAAVIAPGPDATGTRYRPLTARRSSDRLLRFRESKLLGQRATSFRRPGYRPQPW